MDMMEKLYGDYSKELKGLLDQLDPDFSEIIQEFPYEKIWSRPGLSLKERSIATISSLIAMGKEDQIEIHMKGFLNSGGTEQELKEVIVHLSIYCGFPAAMNAFKVLNKARS